MKCWKWILAAAALSLIFSGGVAAQTLDLNQLCIHNGGEYYTNGPYWGFPNWGMGRYFPSYAHRASTPVEPTPGLFIYPWKVAGWGWRGMMANNHGNDWFWETCLQKSQDNPYAPTMSFDYPTLYCNGTVPVSGGPKPVYGGVIPTSVPGVGGNGWIYPSSMGGMDGYMNIFASLSASWVVPSTQPFYAVKFGVYWDCASAATVPSSHSIWEMVWTMKGTYGQYCGLSGNEKDCLGGPANSGRNYSLTCDFDNGKYWYWNNTGSGTDNEWAFCIFVCDAVTIPVNIPGDSSTRNPFNAYGFDVGIGALVPKLSSNCVQLGFMTQDYTGKGGSRVALASFAMWPCIGPYGKSKYRVPHGFDILTNLFLSLSALFMHTPAPSYPACFLGDTTGAHSSSFIPFPPDPALMCAELRYSSFATGKGQPMSASFMVTYF